MTFEDALKLVKAVLSPCSLSGVQIDVFRGTWNDHSYVKIAQECNYKDSYIKDVGSELWQLLTQELGIKVTKLNLREALMQYVQLQQMRDRPALSHQRVDWGEAPDVSQFCGRGAQLAKLEEWVMQQRCRMLAIVGMGGIGKTTIVTRLAQQLVDTEQFDIVVWRSLRQAPPLKELLIDLMSAMAAPAVLGIAPGQSLPLRIDVMMRQLLEQLRDRRCLLILDNVEAVLQGSELVGTYRPGYEDYGWLFQQLGAGRHQSSVLLTSREIPAQISIQAGPTAAVRLLRLEPLSTEEGKSILAAKGLEVQTEQLQQVQKLIERYQGNPLALEIVATPIKELFNSNIAAFLAQDTLLFKDIRDLLAHQFARLTSLERQVMYWLAIEREPVTAAQLQADLLPSVTPLQLRYALQSLNGRSLIEKSQQNLAPAPMNLDGVSYTQQAMVMEYVTSQLIEQVCQELEQVQIDCLRSHALVKAQAKDYIKDVQTRLILQPTLAQLLEVTGSKESLKNLLLELLKIQQVQAPLQRGYFAANAIHLLRQLGVDLSHLDFSNLTVWQADLQTVDLHETNFSGADLSYSTFTQSISDILSVAFSPDGKQIATSHDNGEVYVWQLADGQQIATFRASASWVKSLAFSPDGETLAIANHECIVKLLHIPSQTVRRELHGHTSSVLSVAISPDGRFLASSGEDPTIIIWDMHTGEQLKTLAGHEYGWLPALAFVSAPSTPDQSYLLASGGGDHTVRLWDIRSGQIHTFTGHTQGVLAVAFSPDGRQIASSSVDRTIRLWDVQTGQELAAWQGHDNAAAWTLAFSPDGQTLASGGEDQTIKLWDVATRQCRRILLGHTAVVQSLAFSPDGQTIVSAALNQSIRLWDAQTGQHLKTWQGYSQAVFCVVFHPQGRILASCHGDKAVRLWDVQTGECLSCLQGHSDRIASVAFSPDGRIIASGSFDRTIRLWDVKSGKFIRSLRSHGWINSVAFSADGAILASSGIDRVVRLWDVATGQCLRVIEPEVNWVPSVAFSPLEKCLANGSEDGTVKLWHADTANCLLTLKGHTRQVQAIAFDSTERRLASGSDDHTVKLWDLQTGQCLQTLQGHNRAVVSISFHPQGNLIASGSFDRTLKLWDLQQGINIATLQGHTSPIRSATFAPDGKMLVSGSEDGTVRIWDSFTGECLRVLTALRPYEGMNISGVTGLTDAQTEALRLLGAIAC
ncbi:WD40 domain-containing protein [Aliterella atlantica]|uniref:AAA+ ATPase domain-containing protein n=1 Tax=Aliterella atlantica CENA595 TaxID=1618023 RepID=A0A0D8ZLY9_9CYAN|nr:NB-ARC domain-containing protein [Aliterella atlantica]KJH69454.1 hypothetical protein UH38_23860 [Aliterella atlantica CENA595]